MAGVLNGLWFPVSIGEDGHDFISQIWVKTSVLVVMISDKRPVVWSNGQGNRALKTSGGSVFYGELSINIRGLE